jgi:ribosomal silencing factor RsfS
VILEAHIWIIAMEQQMIVGIMSNTNRDDFFLEQMMYDNLWIIS